MTIGSGPSLHLSWSELACKDGTPYPMIWRSTRALILSIEFEAFRQACGGRPLKVLSAFRTAEWNRLVGASKNSQHPRGRALDILKPPELTLKQFWELARVLALRQDSQLFGIGRYSWGVHLDTRPSARVVIWNGMRLNADRVI